MVRVVVDTNVLISAVLGRGKPRTLVLELFEGHVILSSAEMLAEFTDVIERQKFRHIRRSHIQGLLTLLINYSNVVKPLESFYGTIPEDPDDDIVLSVAFAGKAEYIVTGDPHLLRLGEFKRIKIIRVSDMLNQIR